MGKNGRKGDKKEHKERVQQRREQRLQEADTAREDDLPQSRRAIVEGFYVGDRVWLDEGNQFRRCILSKEADEEGIAFVVDVDLDPSGNEQRVAADRLRRDPWPWVLEFGVGDRVVFYNDAAQDPRWMPATVVRTMILDGRVPGRASEDAYQVELEDGELVSVAEEFRPLKHLESFRFAVGEKVLFHYSSAMGVKNMRASETWMEGEVVRVDILNRSDFYAVYEVHYHDRGRLQVCYIEEDADDLIAGACTTPRQRLLDAIDHGCRYEHLDSLVNSSGLDVGGFVELVYDHAVKHASYDGLSWLQKNSEVNLFHFGRTDHLFGRLFQSPKAFRFIKRAAQLEGLNGVSRQGRINLIGYGIEPGLVNHPFGDQEVSSLRSLIQRGDMKAMVHLFSFGKGLGWSLHHAVSSSALDGRSLVSFAMSTGNYAAAKLVEEAFRSSQLASLASSLRYGLRSNSLDAPSLEMLVQPTLAKPFVRFCVRSEDHHAFNASIFELTHRLSCEGSLSALRWLIEADQSLLNSTPQRHICPFENQDEFIQPELFIKCDRKYPKLNLVEAAAIGGRTSTLDVETKSDIEWYTKDILENGRHQPSFDSFLARLEQHHQSNNYGYEKEAILEYKIVLLKDAESLAKQLEVLNYLVNCKGLEPPSALSVLRWRRCGVLRWLVSIGAVDLSAKASTRSNLVRETKGIGFLGGRRMPPELSVGGFLCLAAVECDDLQSLTWLLDEQEVPMASARCYGWNLAHACAHFGRSEIALCLLQRADWRELLQEPCRRKPMEAMFPVHIAVSKGFVFVADLLLDAGCPSIDRDGKSLESYTEQSKLPFVREWGKEKVKSSALDSDVKKLLQLVSAGEFESERVKKHLVDSGCLDFTRWEEAQCSDATVPGPCGQRYNQLVVECCKHADSDFVSWLCSQLPPASHDDPWHWSQWLLFWGLDPYDPHAWSENDWAQLLPSGDLLLAHWVDLTWAPKKAGAAGRRSRTADPRAAWIGQNLGLDARLSEALDHHKQKSLRILFCKDLRLAAERTIRRFLSRGESSSSVSEIIGIIQEVTLHLASIEGQDQGSYFAQHCAVDAHGRLSMETYIYGSRNDKTFPLKRFLPFVSATGFDQSRLWVILAMEGYDELIRFCRERSHNWSASIEIRMTRIAAYLGLESTVDYFLRLNGGFFHRIVSSIELLSWELLKLGVLVASLSISMH